MTETEQFANYMSLLHESLTANLFPDMRKTFEMWRRWSSCLSAALPHWGGVPAVRWGGKHRTLQVATVKVTLLFSVNWLISRMVFVRFYLRNKQSFFCGRFYGDHIQSTMFHVKVDVLLLFYCRVVYLWLLFGWLQHTTVQYLLLLPEW